MTKSNSGPTKKRIPGSASSRGRLYGVRGDGSPVCHATRHATLAALLQRQGFGSARERACRGVLRPPMVATCRGAAVPSVAFWQPPKWVRGGGDGNVRDSFPFERGEVADLAAQREDFRRRRSPRRSHPPPTKHHITTGRPLTFIKAFCSAPGRSARASAFGSPSSPHKSSSAPRLSRASRSPWRVSGSATIMCIWSFKVVST